MQALLQDYSLTEIIIFLVVAAIAFKGVVTFFDWAAERIKKVFDKEQKKINDKQRVQTKLTNDYYRIEDLEKNQKALEQKISAINDTLDILLESDRNSIKAYLTQQHYHFCEHMKSIDYYNLECCESRYKDYKKEGGNSFIDDLMNQIRELPKQEKSMDDEKK